MNKPKLSIWVCVLVALCLVAFGLLFGTVRGYNMERAQVEKKLSGDNGLLDALDYRGIDGLNLSVVASRHLTDNEDVQKLQAAARVLRDANASLADKKAADERMTDAVRAVSKAMKETATFAASQRDVSYLSQITNDLAQWALTIENCDYDKAAADFNKSLNDPIGGFFAKVLGVKAMELYGGEQE